MFDFLLDSLGKIKNTLDGKRASRRWKKLQEMGMHIGKDAYLPMSTWIDSSHCFLISIGDRCRFGPNCVILAHDASMKEFLDAGRIGRVIIHESCAFGFGTVILPGVEIGPRVISAAKSVITSNIPSDSVVAGNPAKVIGNLKHFVGFHAILMKKSPLFKYEEYGLDCLPSRKQKEILEKLGKGCGYITGGHSDMLKKDTLL